MLGWISSTAEAQRRVPISDLGAKKDFPEEMGLEYRLYFIVENQTFQLIP